MNFLTYLVQLFGISIFGVCCFSVQRPFLAHIEGHWFFIIVHLLILIHSYIILSKKICSCECGLVLFDWPLMFTVYCILTISWPSILANPLISSLFFSWYEVTTPFKPRYQHASSPHCSSYISYGTSWENLHTNQVILSLMIISFILMTCMFDQVVILWGEIRCLSLFCLRIMLTDIQIMGVDLENENWGLRGMFPFNYFKLCKKWGCLDTLLT